jgi:hypothetical protein
MGTIIKNTNYDNDSDDDDNNKNKSDLLKFSRLFSYSKYFSYGNKKIIAIVTVTCHCSASGIVSRLQNAPKA